MTAQPANLGPYRIVKTLGQGGMGIVYRGEHRETGRPAAVKTVLVPHHGLLAGIRREIHALARIEHPGVVRILDHGLHEGLPWYAMELLEGRSLREHIAQSRGGTLQDALTLARRLCGPLAYLHGEGILHRDLKPDNVLVVEERRTRNAPVGAGLALPIEGEASLAPIYTGLRLVLVDFGLVSQVGGPLGHEVLDLGGMPTGTAAYMAPEQARGQLLDARADLYALGCILYELLTGRPPFVSEIPFQVLYQHCNVAPVPPSQLVPGIAPDLDALLLRLLAKQPSDRLGYAADVAQALGRLGALEADWPEAPRIKSYLYRPGFAGRDAALRQLEERLSRLERGDGGLALVGGESGAGKTRLTTELARQTAGREIQLLAGECLAPESGRSDARGGALHPLRRALQSIADRAREGGAAEAERLFGRRAQVLALYEPALRGLPGLVEAQEAAPLPAEAARLRLFMDLTETFAALAARGHSRAPVLLILDDLQWADDLTLGWLEHLMRAGVGGRSRAPLLVVGTYRNEEIADAATDAGAATAEARAGGTTAEAGAHRTGARQASPLRTLLEGPHVLVVELGRLDGAAVGAMVADMLALDRPPAALAAFLAETSGGNPFFVAEYLRAAVDEGLLRRDSEGRWLVAETGPQAEAFAALPLPTSLQPLALRRLEGLSQAARRLVEAAAVLGREGHSLLVWRMAHLEIPDLFDAMAEVLRRHVLEEVGTELLRFVHDQLREAAYTSIEPQRRSALHREAAEHIEALLVGERQEYLAVLGHHWEQAGVRDRAREAYRAAARKAVAAHAHEEAERLLRAYLRLTEPGTPEHSRALHELAQDVLQVRGRFAEAIEVLDQVLAAVRQAADRRSEAAALNGLAAARWALGQTAEALGLCEQALALSRELADPEMEGRSLSHLAILYAQQGRRADARPLYERSLELARQLGDRAAEGATLGNLGILHSYAGEMSEAEALFKQVLHIAREQGDRRGEGLTLANLAHLYHDQRRFEQAQPLYEQALELFRQAGFRAPESRFMMSLAQLHRDCGRIEQAKALYGQAIVLARAMGDRRNEERWTAELAAF